MTTDINTNPLLQQIDLGFQAESFLQSDLGRYLIARAEAEIEAAVEKLKRIDPENSALIRAEQHKIHVAEDIQYWLAEAIQAGYNAQAEFQGDAP